MTDNLTETTSARTKEPLAKPGECIRAKWTMDGAKTLDEAAGQLEAYARWLRQLHEAGWPLTNPVDDDYGFLTDPSGNSGYCPECSEWLAGEPRCDYCPEASDAVVVDSVTDDARSTGA